MKCEECEVLIEEYIDGELDRAAADRVAAHLMGCASCSAAAEEVRGELELYARYEREVAVTPALWAAVESRIRQEKVTREPGLFARLRRSFAGVFAAPRLSPAFAAAMVLVAVGVTLFLTNYINSRREAGAGQTVATNPQPAQPARPPAAPGKDEQVATSLNPAEEKISKPIDKEKINNAPQRQLTPKAQPASADQLAREAEQKYLAAINILQRDVKGGTRLEPAVRARFEVALAEIDRTIMETRKVVRQNPNDPTALQYLLGAYSKKVDVLREMSKQSITEDQ